MSATNSTPTINLPLFIGTDKPAWLTDWNGSMNAIDSAIATLQTAESGTATALALLSQSVTALSGTVEQHTTAIQTVTTATATNTGSINTITSLIGNGEPTTTDKTIIGAINEIYGDIGGGDGVDADEVNYDNTSSGLTATDVQAAIDEVNSKIPESGIEDYTASSEVTGNTAITVPATAKEFIARIEYATGNFITIPFLKVIGTGSYNAGLYRGTTSGLSVKIAYDASANTVSTTSVLLDGTETVSTVKTIVYYR